MTACLLTISDSVSNGLANDRSGPEMKIFLLNWKGNTKIMEEKVVPDDTSAIQFTIKRWCDTLKPKPHLILTSGGTGFGPRDVTPEAVKPLLERETHGLTAKIMQDSLKITPMACLSRAVTGIRGETLIITLPGKPKAVVENLEFIEPVLEHALLLIRDVPHSHHKTSE